jgi:hypothetical protein
VPVLHGLPWSGCVATPLVSIRANGDHGRSGCREQGVNATHVLIVSLLLKQCQNGSGGGKHLCIRVGEAH